ADGAARPRPRRAGPRPGREGAARRARAAAGRRARPAGAPLPLDARAGRHDPGAQGRQRRARARPAERPAAARARPHAPARPRPPRTLRWEEDAAAAAASEALAVHARSPDALGARAEVLLRDQRVSEGLAAAEAALRVNPRHGPSLALRATSLWLLGRKEEAE